MPSTDTAEHRRGLREFALSGVAFPLYDEAGAFGPAILPLSPWHHLMLLGYGNPILCGGRRTTSAVLQYLWICSPCFQPNAPLRFRLFRLRHYLAIAWRRARALSAIEAHAGMISLDRPPLPVERRSKGQAALLDLTPRDGPHELAAFELICRRHLGYSRAEYWHTCYGHTNQLLALHFAASAPDAPSFDRARDKIKGERLRARKAARLARVLDSQPLTRN